MQHKPVILMARQGKLQEVNTIISILNTQTEI